MHPRLLFLFGFACGWWTSSRRESVAELRFETEALRFEVTRTREVLEVSRDLQAGCEWEKWIQRWFLRLSVFLDVGLLFWIVYSRTPSSLTPARLPTVPEPSSDSDELQSLTEPLVPWKPTGGKSVKGSRRGPLRPSDLKKGQ